ncbi:ABC transporter substrate-binding protein [Rhodococcus hoagii]|nr:ABC transporter substrate-binding protein [Prescottella equi]MBM4473716.1 ABC transporter substrate-binding protein [Prescottella equi]MBM4473719.1 ABC transporter substrate-binding protein [Prescottella equi]MBM4473837.1 ABC transporter substrate-binding protein [Prescottella equi]MBM4473841.1 ABC transporter substrate-binding protein [Prescottella equi]
MSSAQPVRSRRIAAVALATVALVGLAGCGSGTADDASTIVRTTTKIAGAGVVNVERDTGNACAEPSPADPGAADPQRIVVLDTAALDAVCALGLQGRVVGTVTPDGADRQPSYLGPGVAALPGIGPAGAPDVDLVAKSAPDLIVGAAPADPVLADRLRALAPTAFVGADAVFWKNRFLATGEALGRSGAARQALDACTADAARIGNDLAAQQTQASVVRFGADSLAITGPGSFSGQVLADAGVQRPAYQRLEVAAEEIDDLGTAEGDVIYVSFDGPDGLEHGKSVMDSDEWYALGAVPDKRVFAVDDEIWNGGNGIVAARAVLADLQPSLNGYA